MKFYKKTIILIVVMSLLFVICLFFYNGETEHSASAVDKTKLLDIKSEDVVKIEMNNKGGKFVFEKVDTGWRAIAPVNLKFDMSRINGILFAISNLDIGDIIDKQPSDFNQYGLADPASIGVKLKDNSMFVLEIGNITPYGDGYYIKKKDEPIVYKAEKGLCSEFLRQGKDFRDGRLFDMTIDDFTALTIRKEDKVILDIQKDDILWDVFAPIEGTSDLNGVEPVFSMLSYLCISDYIEDDAKDMGKYGLERPSYTIGVKSDKINKTLVLGKTTNEDDAIYARFEDSGDVWKLKLKDLYLIDNPIKDLSVFAYAELMENVTGIEIEIDNKINNFKIDAEKNDIKLSKYYLNGKLIEGTDSKGISLFQKFYQTISSIAMTGIEYNYMPKGKPDIIFTYTLNKKSEIIKVEFIQKDELNYYVVKNGRYTGMQVLKSTFDEPEGVRDSYRNLIKTVGY